MRREAKALESTPMEVRTKFRKHGTRRTKVTSFTKAMDGANVLKLKQKPDPEKTWTVGGRAAPSSTSISGDLAEHETTRPPQNVVAGVHEHLPLRVA
jgi:hypothetical protein